jgi:hypothetical protein
MGEVIRFPLHRARQPVMQSDCREALRLTIMLDWWSRERAMLAAVRKSNRDQKWSEDFAEAVEKVDRLAARLSAVKAARRKSS